MKTARLVQPSDKGVKCLLCAHGCDLADGQTGICRVRKNVDGEIKALNYHRVAATHSDPIEKKPLYHFLPASTSFSVATMGCNFSCTFCQNHSLSMVKDGPIHGQDISPEQLVESALHYNAQSISYTYTEPTIYFELMSETAKLAKQAGLKNVMVSNGYMSAEALEAVGPFIDAANIDLKAFNDAFYKKYCGARLQPVLETIKGMKERGIWVELTTLLIPDLNDDPEEVKQLISFILSVDASTPWHVSRFYPQHLMNDHPATDPGVMFKYLETAQSMGLKYLYAGNLHSHRWGDTLCPQCHSLLIERSGYFTSIKGMNNGCCASCGAEIAGVWS